MAAIETRGLRKEFGDVTAVADVDLTVERGEVFGFLGPNGAGKSTTINVLLDYVRRSAGDVSVLGFDPAVAPREVRERTGVLPEASGFYERDTARDHLRFAIRMQRASDDVAELLDRVGLADAADRAVGGFSTGMRQRLGLAVALVGNPDLLILDEPMAGLDPTGARLLREVVREERDRGAAVFFSSHIMDQVESVCDRVGIMHAGELVAADDLATLRTGEGTTSRLTLRLDAVPAGLADRVAARDGVADVAASGRTLHVDCAEAGVKATVVATVDGSGATIRDIESETPSLERVFVAVTDGEEP